MNDTLMQAGIWIAAGGHHDALPETAPVSQEHPVIT